MLLSSRHRSLKEHSDKQRKRGLDSPGLLCSALPVNALQSVSLQKTEGLSGEGRGGGGGVLWGRKHLETQHKKLQQGKEGTLR